MEVLEINWRDKKKGSSKKKEQTAPGLPELAAGSSSWPGRLALPKSA